MHSSQVNGRDLVVSVRHRAPAQPMSTPQFVDTLKRVRIGAIMTLRFAGYVARPHRRRVKEFLRACEPKSKQFAIVLGSRPDLEGLIECGVMPRSKHISVKVLKRAKIRRGAVVRLIDAGIIERIDVTNPDA